MLKKMRLKMCMSRKNIHRGDILYANLGDGVGSEQRGIRPVVVIQNNKGNVHSSVIIVAPITSKIKNNLPTHVIIESNSQNNLSCKSVIMFEQITRIDKRRILRYVGHISDMNFIDKAIQISLGLTA